MDEFLDENSRKRLIKELVEGKAFGTQLQSLLKQPIENHDGSVSADELVRNIWRCFTQALSELNNLGNYSNSLVLQTQIEEVDQPHSNHYSTSELKKKNKHDRRGCYKRRKTSYSWMRESERMDDGCAWRKYGQKKILNSKYPRCYYRCTHKYDQDCRATKQVQKMQENPIMYHTTYFGNHTCNSKKIQKHTNLQFNNPMLESPPFEVNPKISSSVVTHNSTLKEKEEEEEEEEESSQGQSDNVSSTMDSNVWKDFMLSSPSAHNSCFQRMISSDMEDFVKFGDFDEAMEFF